MKKQKAVDNKIAKTEQAMADLTVALEELETAKESVTNEALRLDFEKRIYDANYKLTVTLPFELNKLKTAKMTSEKESDIDTNMINAIIQTFNIRYLANGGRYVLEKKGTNEQWLKRNELKGLFSVLEDFENFQVFSKKLEIENRKKITIVNRILTEEEKTEAFGNISYVNIDHYLKNRDKMETAGTDYHWFFDALFESLGGKERLQETVKQVINCKFHNPMKFNIPALCWFDQGGTGKGIFIEMMRTLFGSNTVKVIGSTEINNQWTEYFLGALWIFFDESDPMETSLSKLKRYIHNEKVPLILKMLTNEEVEHIATWSIMTNDEHGPFKIEEGAQNRRFMFIEVVGTLANTLIKYLRVHETEFWESIELLDPKQQNAKIEGWIDKVMIPNVIKNQDEVIKFTKAIIAKQGRIDHVEKVATRAEEELVEMYKPYRRDFFDKVLAASKYEGAVKQDLFDLYKAYAKKVNIGNAGGSKKFFSGMKKYIENNNLDLEERRITVDGRQQYCIVKVGVKTVDREAYMTRDHMGNITGDCDKIDDMGDDGGDKPAVLKYADFKQKHGNLLD